MKILACRVGRAPVVEEMKDNGRSFEAFVGGRAEMIRLKDTPFGIITNSTGDEELLPNRSVVLGINRHCIHGDFFFIRGKAGKDEILFVNVTKKDAVMLAAMLTKSECVTQRVRAAETVRSMLEALPMPMKKEDMN